MDWNWFFSSVAQSAAAIVGVVGAFVITRVIGNQTEYSSKLNLAKMLIIESKALVNEAEARYFEWYNERVFEREVEKIVNDFHETGELLAAEEYYNQYSFSVYDSRLDVVDRLEKKVAELRRQKEEEEKRKSNHPLLGGGYARSIKMPSLSSVNTKIQEERELIDQLLIRITRHCEAVGNLVGECMVNPQSSKLINAALVVILALFFVGVIYPLSFMPVPVGEPPSMSALIGSLVAVRVGILSAVSVIFSAIVVVFFYINMRLKYSNELIVELTELASLENYSIYFANMQRNVSRSG